MEIVNRNCLECRKPKKCVEFGKRSTSSFTQYDNDETLEFLCESCLKKALELINPKQENLENKIKELEKENKVLNDIFINDRATIINKCVKIIELEKQLAEAKQ